MLSACSNPTLEASCDVIAIRSAGEKTPLFLIDDVSGTGTYFRPLASHIDAEIPVFALAAVPDEPQLRTIEGIATRLIGLIRATQPRGPYRVAGRSFGGVLAYEVATQLLGQDEAVEFLGLIDTREPSVWRDAYDGTHCDALRSYAVQPISILVHVFAAEDSPADAVPSAQLGWDAVLPKDRVLLTKTPGDRHTMVTQRALGEAMSKALNAPRPQRPARRESDDESCLTLQIGGSAPVPVFCIPGAGDNVVNFVSFSGALGQKRTVYGLQPRGLDALREPHSTVEAAANAYLRAIDEARPRGPVHLLGHSFGGWVALEIAQRLRESDRAVASLTLIDTEVPGAQREFTSSEALNEWIHAVELVAERSLDVDVEALARLDVAAQTAFLHERLVELGLLPKKSTPQTLRGPIRTFCAALRAPYEPRRPYPGEVHFVLVSDEQLDDESNSGQHEAVVERWRQWAPKLQPWQGPGNHVTILKPPHVQHVADWWNSSVVGST